jgi:hypothetical protein
MTHANLQMDGREACCVCSLGTRFVPLTKNVVSDFSRAYSATARTIRLGHVPDSNAHARYRKIKVQ